MSKIKFGSKWKKCCPKWVASMLGRSGYELGRQVNWVMFIWYFFIWKKKLFIIKKLYCLCLPFNTNKRINNKILKKKKKSKIIHKFSNLYNLKFINNIITIKRTQKKKKNLNVVDHCKLSTFLGVYVLVACKIIINLN